MDNLSTNINGYIEGYYGRLLKWSERHAILKKLKDCKFNSYFYCPKEDLKHRLKWREAYESKWITAFKIFCKAGHKNNLNILIGISPGLDFNFDENNSDFKTLLNKTKILRSIGATHIVLMFDDIPQKETSSNKFSKSEGVLHADLANNLSKELNEIILVVPRVYSDELIDKGCIYLRDFNKTLNKNIPLFYCGKKIVSDTNKKDELVKLQKLTSNRVIFWDNLYANDYCPKKIFLGPYLGRTNFDDTMINPTGLIKTDLFILDLINLSIQHKELTRAWIESLKKHKVPEEFLIISKYFFPINFRKKIYKQKYNFNKDIEALDFLLWKWKSSLSREWYQYMLILKQDLLLLNGNLNLKRITKIFPVPLRDAVLKLKRGYK
jgi:protein O-GlcNAcase/histone acetyltransferase